MGRGPTEEYYKSMNENYATGTLTCLKQEVIRKKITDEFPLVLNIEPTNDCNLKCVYCPREKITQKIGITYMRMEMFRQIIDEIVAQQKKLIMINLHKDGEPLMHPELPEMVKYIKKNKVAETIHLNTNGMLLATDNARKLLEAGIDDITVSIDAAREETFKRDKGIDALNFIEKNVEKFIDMRNKLKAKTFIRVKIMEFEGISSDEIQEFNHKWQKIADQVQITGVHSWSGAIDELSVTDEQSKVRYPCALLWYALAINADGQVSICNVDWDRSGVVGEFPKNSLGEVWNNKIIKKIRQDQINDLYDAPKVCKDCVVWVSAGDMRQYFKTRREFL